MRHPSQPFPLSKLAFMFVRQASEPVAQRIRRRAKASAALRQFIVLPVANSYHFYETRVKMRMLDLARC